jgi:transcriptional regulator with XRE-family HTH domain
MATVLQWSGREARALRLAMRMSVREFASHLGINDSAVSNWERRGDQARLRYQTQQDLDTALVRASDEVRERFELAPAQASQPGPPELAIGLQAGPPLPDGPRRLTHPIDGKVMVLVPAGIFPFGPENQPVSLPAFYIDLTPTTNEDYAKFVAATGYRAPIHWAASAFPDELREHPVVHVTYRDAVRYAQWAQKALPTAAEWEKAARGEKGNAYPWGNQATVAKCNVRESGIDGTTPVHRYRSGVSPYGVYDLSGNVWEWCGTETDPGRFVLKGSAFTSPFDMAAASATNDASSDMQDDDTGFRCVAPAELLDAMLSGTA